MAYNRRLVSITRPAGQSFATLQHTIVELDSTSRVVPATDAATPILGVIMNKPSAAGQAAEIAIVGSVVKCVASATINEGAWVTATTAGEAVATTTNLDNILGMALTTAPAANDLFEVVILGGTLADS